MDGSESFSVDVARRERALVVAPRGEIDIATAPVVAGELERVDAGTERVVLDLSEVEFMDTSGLQLLVVTERRLSETGAALVLVAGPPPVQRVLDVSGIARRLRIEPTLEAALAA